MPPPGPPEVGAPRAALDAVRAPAARALHVLAAAVDGVLGPALERAPRAWERADELEVLDAADRSELAAIEARLRAQLDGPSAAVRAAAAEGLLAVTTGRALVGLLERRLPALIRLRARGDRRDLLPEGRPFLDLAPALVEAARGWSA